jgi:hypothetical protein
VADFFTTTIGNLWCDGRHGDDIGRNGGDIGRNGMYILQIFGLLPYSAVDITD